MQLKEDPMSMAHDEYVNDFEGKSTKKALNEFKDKFGEFPSIFANCLIYHCAYGEHTRKAEEANNLIRKYQLPLIALPTTLRGQNSFTVQFDRSKVSH